MKHQACISLYELAQGKIVWVNKPANWTSFDVVNKLRSVSGIKKVGHAGTLDPFATGVLLICFARATKQVNKLMQLEKEYEGTISLGAETDTHDVTGKIIKESPVPKISEGELKKILAKFHGEIEQIPPMYSALKFKGKRLYEFARKGETVERLPRRVTIYQIELLTLNRNQFRVRVVCSRGTYIRALARDIGRALGCGAFLQELVRTRIGPYHLANAWSLSDVVQELELQRIKNGNI